MKLLAQEFLREVSGKWSHNNSSLFVFLQQHVGDNLLKTVIINGKKVVSRKKLQVTPTILITSTFLFTNTDPPNTTPWQNVMQPSWQNLFPSLWSGAVLVVVGGEHANRGGVMGVRRNAVQLSICSVCDRYLTKY